MHNRPAEWEVQIMALPRGWVISVLAISAWMLTFAAIGFLMDLWAFVAG